MRKARATEKENTPRVSGGGLHSETHTHCPCSRLQSTKRKLGKYVVQNHGLLGQLLVRFHCCFTDHSPEKPTPFGDIWCRVFSIGVEKHECKRSELPNSVEGDKNIKGRRAFFTPPKPRRSAQATGGARYCQRGSSATERGASGSACRASRAGAPRGHIMCPSMCHSMKSTRPVRAPHRTSMSKHRGSSQRGAPAKTYRSTKSYICFLRKGNPPKQNLNRTSKTKAQGHPTRV